MRQFRLHRHNGIDDIFQDNGGKILQMLLALSLKDMDDPSPTELFVPSRLCVTQTGAGPADSETCADGGPTEMPEMPLPHPADGPPPRFEEDTSLTREFVFRPQAPGATHPRALRWRFAPSPPSASNPNAGRAGGPADRLRLPRSLGGPAAISAPLRFRSHCFGKLGRDGQIPPNLTYQSLGRQKKP